MVFSCLSILHKDVEVFHRESGCYFEGIRTVWTDKEALVGNVVGDCFTLHGEVVWEAGDEEVNGYAQDLVACCFGSWEALYNIWMGGPEEIVADLVFRGIVGVKGEPVGLLQTFETH